MAGRTLWCQATTGLKNYDVTDIKWDLPMGTVKEGIRRNTEQGFGRHGALGCSFRLGRKCVTYCLNWKMFSKDALIVPCSCVCLWAVSQAAASSQSRSVSSKRLQWPLDVGTRNTCQPLVSGRPKFSQGMLPCGGMACYQLPGIWTGSDINLTSKRRWKWK